MPAAGLDRQPWASLEPLLAEAGMDPAATILRLRQFAELLATWNRNISNLISKNDEGRIVTRHLLESIHAAAWMKSTNAKQWIDFGSGAGLPAIPLALIGVGERWTLVESRRPKVLFLRKAIEELGLRDVSVIHTRLEMLAAEDPEHLGAYDGFTSRATLALGPTLVLAKEFVKTGGAAFLWKGTRLEEEMAEDSRWRSSWRADGSHTVSDQTSVVKFINNI